MRDDRLREDQRRVALSALAEESAHRDHLVVHLSGAHAYGFPSPDSDLDLKAIHIADTRSLLGLAPPPPAANRLEIIDGFEIDYTSNELGQCVGGLLKGDGNMLERVLSQAWVGERDPRCDGMAEHARATLSRRVHRHYAGFARSQYKRVLEDASPTAKRVLYVLRTALTGVHLLRTGECEPDLTRLHHRYDVPEVDALVAQKQLGEKHPLPDPLSSVAVMDRVLTLLDRARDESELPEEPNADAARAFERWLVDTRMQALR
jgi:predicted nucleotidyltransferase